MAQSPIRRIITGHDSKNIAKVILEGPATNTKRPREGVASTLMWSSDEMPAGTEGNATKLVPGGERMFADERTDPID